MTRHVARRSSLAATVTLGAALFAAACGTTASDGDTVLAGKADAPAGVPAPPAYREVRIPSGTELSLKLTTAIASDTSRVEDTVRAELSRAVSREGLDVLPVGAMAAGTITEAGDARVSGRALVVFRFTSVRTGGEEYEMQTVSLSRLAPAGAAGTGATPASGRKEVRLDPGADVSTRLTAPLTVRVRVSG